jgi:hypothetical protein
MRDVKQLGLWTGAGLYLAIGVIGVVLFAAQSHDVTTTDGYGIARIAVATSTSEPHR